MLFCNKKTFGCLATKKDLMAIFLKGPQRPATPPAMVERRKPLLVFMGVLQKVRTVLMKRLQRLGMQRVMVELRKRRLPLMTERQKLRLILMKELLRPQQVRMKGLRRQEAQQVMVERRRRRLIPMKEPQKLEAGAARVMEGLRRVIPVDQVRKPQNLEDKRRKKET